MAEAEFEVVGRFRLEVGIAVGRTCTAHVGRDIELLQNRRAEALRPGCAQCCIFDAVVKNAEVKDDLVIVAIISFVATVKFWDAANMVDIDLLSTHIH